jgi:hypothetical protein
VVYSRQKTKGFFSSKLREAAEAIQREMNGNYDQNKVWMGPEEDMEERVAAMIEVCEELDQTNIKTKAENRKMVQNTELIKSDFDLLKIEIDS